MFEGKDVKVLLASAGSGKGNWVGCKIPTPDGLKLFGELKEGDYVFDRTGKPTKILGVYPRGKLDAYKVTLSDGRSTIVSLDHLWTVSKVGSKKSVTLSLEDMLKDGIRGIDKRVGRKFGSPKYYVPANGIQQYEERPVACASYVFGAFMGNGCLTEPSLAFSSNDEETVKKVASLLGADYKKRSAYNFTWDFFKNGRRVRREEYFPSLNSSQKYIPSEYKYNSVEVRKALLQGLFDTDGSAVIIDNRLHVTYSTVSEQLKNDIVEVLQGLGISCSVREDKREGRNICYCININSTRTNKISLFSLQRKKEVCIRGREMRHNYSRIAIRSVEKLPSPVEINCIYVDNDEHLYQCDNGIVTHNTATLINLVTEELKERRPEEIAFVTFTKKGAEEGLNRICHKFDYSPDELPYFRTLHSLTFHALGLKHSQIFSSLDQKKFNKAYGYYVNRAEVSANRAYPTKDSAYLDYYDLERSCALTTKQMAESDIDVGYYRSLVQKYEEYKSANALVDFFDCLIKYVQEGDSLPCKVVMIDEAQDITALQWKVIEKAFSEAEKIYVAGDDKQSIYQYSGARPDILIGLSRQFPVEYLNKSYRIPVSVFNFASAITKFIGEKSDLVAEPRIENGQGKVIQLSEIERLSHFINFEETNSDKCSWYILARNKCFLESASQMLEEHLIPYWTCDGFFMGGEVMKRLNDYENFAIEGYKDEKKKQAFIKKFGITDFSKPFTDTNLFTEGRKWVYQSYIECYGLPKLKEMCKWKPQIYVGTMHSVKGGEADNVALLLDTTRRTQGTVFSDIDEELRVLYVGVTRAKKNLFLIDSKDGKGYDKIVSALKNEYGLDFS